MTMVWAFLIAAVLVSPFAYVTFRRILAERRAAAAENDDAPVDDRSDPAVPEHDARRVVADLRAEALAHDPGDRFELTVPPGATIGGRPAEPDLVVRLVADDLRRSGVEVDATGPGTTLRCHIPS